jgi:chromate transporter
MIWVGALTGVQIMVLALIARAVEKIGRHAIAGARLWGVAVFALAATLLHAPFWLPLVVGGVVGVLRAPRLVLAGLLIVALGLAYLMGDRTAGPSVAIQASEPTLWLLFLAGLKGGLLTFGGAYTAIPYVQADTVGRGWISGPAFLDGVAFAGVLPAPLVIFSTFAGYLAGGVPGALVITAGMFLPAFAFSLVLYERLEALVEAPTLHDTLTGVAAAVVGVIAGVWLRMAWTTGAAVPSLVVGMLIFIVALTAIWRLKSRWAAPVVIIGGAVAGHLALG